MIVYVKNGATPDQIAVIGAGGAARARPEIIENVEYCDDRRARSAQAQTLFAGDPGLAAVAAGENIPSYFKVVPVDKDSSELLQSSQTAFSRAAQRAACRLPDEQIDVLGQLQGFFGVRTLRHRRACCCSPRSLLIWNTIRTAMFARRREIEVMKLVGATNWFIRLPFMLEGLLQGLAGAAFGSGVAAPGQRRLDHGCARASRSTPGLGGFVVTDGYPSWVVIFMVICSAPSSVPSVRPPPPVASSTSRRRCLAFRRHGRTRRSSYEVDDHVATITLNRPEQLNAFTGHDDAAS